MLSLQRLAGESSLNTFLMLSLLLQIVYDNSPRGHYRNAGGDPSRMQQILGGEAAMWTEQVMSKCGNGKNTTMMLNSGGWRCSDAQAVASRLSTWRTTLERPGNQLEAGNFSNFLFTVSSLAVLCMFCVTLMSPLGTISNKNTCS